MANRFYIKETKENGQETLIVNPENWKWPMTLYNRFDALRRIESIKIQYPNSKLSVIENEIIQFH